MEVSEISVEQMLALPGVAIQSTDSGLRLDIGDHYYHCATHGDPEDRPLTYGQLKAGGWSALIDLEVILLSKSDDAEVDFDDLNAELRAHAIMLLSDLVAV